MTPFDPARIRCNDATLRHVQAIGPYVWRKPVNGVWVAVNATGRLVAKIRTLGTQLPKDKQKKALYIEGV